MIKMQDQKITDENAKLKSAKLENDRLIIGG